MLGSVGGYQKALELIDHLKLLWGRGGHHLEGSAYLAKLLGDESQDLKRTLVPARKKGVSTFLTSGVRFVARYAEGTDLPGGVDRQIGSIICQT